MGEARRRQMMGMEHQFDVREAVVRQCEKCGCDYFEKVFRIGMIPMVAPGNKTGREVQINKETLLCLKCGHEFGSPVLAVN